MGTKMQSKGRKKGGHMGRFPYMYDLYLYIYIDRYRYTCRYQMNVLDIEIHVDVKEDALAGLPKDMNVDVKTLKP